MKLSFLILILAMPKSELGVALLAEGMADAVVLVGILCMGAGSIPLTKGVLVEYPAAVMRKLVSF